MNLLTVDFDYFFPMPAPDDYDNWQLYDWGQKEASFFIGPIWTIRASGFLRAGMELPTVNDEWRTFSERFTFSDEFTTLYVGESHVSAAGLLHEGFDAIWLYDAHHDAGYQGAEQVAKIREEEQVDCENWMIAYHLWGGVEPEDMHVRYPRWKTWALDPDSGEPEPAIPVDRKMDDGQDNEVVFDGLYICRSGAWTPPWCDDQFDQFCLTWGADEISDELAELTNDAGLAPREFDVAEAQAHVDQMNELLERVKE